MNEIVFTLNNTDEHHFYSSFALSLFNLMLLDERPSAIAFVEALGYYDRFEFDLLYDRVNRENVHVPMTLKEAVIFYSAIHFACAALLDPAEEDLFKEAFSEDEEGFVVVRNKLMTFGTIATDMFCNNFLKDNPAFLAVAARVRNIEL